MTAKYISPVTAMALADLFALESDRVWSDRANEPSPTKREDLAYWSGELRAVASIVRSTGTGEDVDEARRRLFGEVV